MKKELRENQELSSIFETISDAIIIKYLQNIKYDYNDINRIHTIDTNYKKIFNKHLSNIFVDTEQDFYENLEAIILLLKRNLLLFKELKVIKLKVKVKNYYEVISSEASPLDLQDLLQSIGRRTRIKFKNPHEVHLIFSAIEYIFRVNKTINGKLTLLNDIEKAINRLQFILNNR